MTDNDAHIGYKQPGVFPTILKKKKLSVRGTAILWAGQVAMIRVRDLKFTFGPLVLNEGYV